MDYVKHKMIIAGAGGIGTAAGLILAEQPDFDCELLIGDLHLGTAQRAADWIQKGASSLLHIEPFQIHPQEVTEHMDYVLRTGDILLDCLPGSEAPRMAQFARKYNLHYVNLTEHVSETQQILEIAQGASTGFILQSGLAPGYIDILANHLYKEFVQQYGVEEVESISMKVGALPKMTTGPHFYGFTWSPIGVATEYVKDAVIIRNGIKTNCPSLSDTTSLILDGIAYEDDYTSGGAADLPDHFLGKVRSLEYKTIRYPGHFNWVRNQLNALPGGSLTESALLEKMLDEIPFSEDDMIILYVSVKGKDQQGVLRIKEKSMKIEPSQVGSHKLKAIQTATAAPMLESARMLLSNQYQGPILQSQIDTEAFLNGSFIQSIYHPRKLRELV